MSIEEIHNELKEEQEDISKEVSEIITVLESITNDICLEDPDLVKQSVDEFLSQDDIAEMIALYESCFSQIPNNNQVKQYVLHLFHILQIPITRTPVIEETALN
jgi:hypothetical protein